MKLNDVILEAASPAQQAAIAKKKKAGVVKEQQLNEFAPLLALGARLFMAAAPKIAQVAGRAGQAGARGAGQVARAGTEIAAKNAGKIGMGAGAYEIGSSVADIAKDIAAKVGTAIDEKTVLDLAALAFKYAIPAGIVLAVLYGGKKAIDSLFDDPKGQQGMAEGLDEAVGGNYLYHATSSDINVLKNIISNGLITNNSNQERTGSKLRALSFTRNWRYALTSTDDDNQGTTGIANGVIFVVDQSILKQKNKMQSVDRPADIINEFKAVLAALPTAERVNDLFQLMDGSVTPAQLAALSQIAGSSTPIMNGRQFILAVAKPYLADKTNQQALANAQSKIKQAISYFVKTSAGKSIASAGGSTGSEYEEVILTPLNYVPFKDLGVVGYMINPVVDPAKQQEIRNLFAKVGVNEMPIPNSTRPGKGMAEGKADYNFDIEDLKRLEQIRDLSTLKAQALALISKPSAKPMKPEKVEWFKNALERMNSPLRVIKLMYDLLLSGEGKAVVGTRSSMNPNSYRQRFGEQAMPDNFNGEYDDEAGMAETNLITIARAAQGLLDTIDNQENLPEWVQEKIAKVEGMMVVAWDYLKSQEVQGIDPRITESICTEQEAHEIFDDFERVVAARGLNEDIYDNVTDEDIIRETAAWRRKEGKSKKGGLNAKGVASYRRENPGSKLQMAVTTKPSKLKKGSKASKRRKSFCARMSGVKGPMKKPNGKPTRKALALRKWNC